MPFKKIKRSTKEKLDYVSLVKQNWLHLNKIGEKDISQQMQRSLLAKRRKHIAEVIQHMPSLSKILGSKRKHA